LLLPPKDYKVIERQGLGVQAMSKDVIHVGGEDVVVREDTAKSYRGVIWALGSIGIILVVTGIILFFVLFRAATDSKPATGPSNTQQNAR
jgi:hypothetical protein